MKPNKTIILTEDQFETLFKFVNEKVERIVETSVDYQDSQILVDWEDLFDVYEVLERVNENDYAIGQQPLKCNPIEINIIMATKHRTTPREKTIIKLMEMVIDTLSYCDDLSDPAFEMYYVMQDAVNKEVIYPLEKDPRQFREERDYI